MSETKRPYTAQEIMDQNTCAELTHLTKRIEDESRKRDGKALPSDKYWTNPNHRYIDTDPVSSADLSSG